MVSLSFDCDTTKDTESLPGLLDLLGAAELVASFAVIGELVQAAPEAYGLVREGGHELLNHGQVKHTQQRPDGSFYSSRFYHELSEDEIRDDIVDNHRLVQDLLSVEMQGFRTPHYSTFQRPQNRSLVYSILDGLGYTYSSSVTSVLLKSQGRTRFGDLWEFPLTGCWDDLRSPFDSWGLIAAPDRRYQDDDFYRLFVRMFQSALESPTPLFLNFYFDPAHVVDFTGFHLMLDDLVAHRDEIQVLKYQDLVCQLTEAIGDQT